VIAILLFAALSLPAQDSRKLSETMEPVAPAQVLAWHLEGLTGEEIRDELNRHGLTERPDEALLSALSAAGADAETIRFVQQTKAPRKIWKLELRLPSPTDYLYEIAGAILFNDRQRALERILAEAEKQPQSADVHLIYAQIARGEQDWITAYGQATQAVVLNPGSPYAHGLRSTICYHSFLRECALREAQEFVRLRPEDASAYIVLGHAQEMLRNYGAALQAFAEAKELHPAYGAIYAGEGACYWRLAAFEKAVKAYEEAIRRDERNVEYYGELAQVYLTEGDAGRAIEVLKKAKELAPDRLEILMALGNAYLVAKRYDSAVEEYRELLDQAPDAEAARAQLIQALLAQGHKSEAERVAIEPQAQDLLMPR
jgi:tetratricopeptide (TPR) repeat protein